MARVEEPLSEQMDLQLEDNEQLVSIDELSDKPKAAEPVQATADVEEDKPEGQQEEQEPSLDMPDKYQGKSIEQIVKMHQEAEKLVGRQSSEVGELRKIVDEFIKSKADEASNTTSPNNEESEVDFFEDPKKAVTNAISNSTEIKQMQELIAKQRQNEVLNLLSQKHPDYMQVIEDPAFGEWVKGSNVRVELLQRADYYDFEAADELLSFWKERKGSVSKAKDVNNKDREQQRKAATTGGKGSGEPISRKIYRRTDIVNLITTNPEKYYANIDEIQKAYEEGRVR